MTQHAQLPVVVHLCLQGSVSVVGDRHVEVEPAEVRLRLVISFEDWFVKVRVIRSLVFNIEVYLFVLVNHFIVEVGKIRGVQVWSVGIDNTVPSFHG